MYIKIFCCIKCCIKLKLRIQQSYSLTNKFNNLHTIDHSDIHEQDIFISGPQSIIKNGIYTCSEVDTYDMAMASS